MGFCFFTLIFFLFTTLAAIVIGGLSYIRYVLNDGLFSQHSRDASGSVTNFRTCKILSVEENKYEETSKIFLTLHICYFFRKKRITKATVVHLLI